LGIILKFPAISAQILGFSLFFDYDKLRLVIVYLKAEIIHLNNQEYEPKNYIFPFLIKNTFKKINHLKNSVRGQKRISDLKGWKEISHFSAYILHCN